MRTSSRAMCAPRRTHRMHTATRRPRRDGEKHKQGNAHVRRCYETEHSRKPTGAEWKKGERGSRENVDMCGIEELVYSDGRMDVSFIRLASLQENRDREKSGDSHGVSGDGVLKMDLRRYSYQHLRPPHHSRM